MVAGGNAANRQQRVVVIKAVGQGESGIPA
jgi:hypothetical protein